MDTLEEFMHFNEMEDAREKMEHEEEETRRDYSFETGSEGEEGARSACPQDRLGT